MICRGSLHEHALAGEVAIVTGGGGGIGFEAARSLLCLGASVVVAEIDAHLCSAAVQRLQAGVSPERVLGHQADIGDEGSVRELVRVVTATFGKIDVVVNNATYAPAGAAVVETPVEAWDRSYAVNLRGPALLARECLPPMIQRRHGTFVCVSSTGGPFLASYETLKAAQLTLANSLDAELADTGVVAFTIGPGLVPTPTALAAIERIAPRLGTTVEAFWQTNRGAVLSVEAAGAGFAAAVAMADRYAGQEISSTQALIDAGIAIPEGESAAAGGAVRPEDTRFAIDACGKVLKTLEEQAVGWKQRSFFERQWMMRDFKQRVGAPVERCLEMLSALQRDLQSGATASGSPDRNMLHKLSAFYTHLGELAAGYVKDPARRREQVEITSGWVAEVDRLIAALPA